MPDCSLEGGSPGRVFEILLYSVPCSVIYIYSNLYLQ